METFTAEQLKDMNLWWIETTQTRWVTLESPKVKIQTNLKTELSSSTPTISSKKGCMILRRRVRRRILKAKKAPPNQMGLCYHCHTTNCLSFQGLNNLSNKQRAKKILERLRDHHPLRSCHTLWKCPQEHNMLHRILYHHPLYSPRHLSIIRLMLLAKLKSNSYRLPKTHSWASLKFQNLKKIKGNPSPRQLERQEQFRNQLLPNRDHLGMISHHLAARSFATHSRITVAASHAPRSGVSFWDRTLR